MIYYCSVITPPSRFVNRKKIVAMNHFHAFRFIQDAYHRVLNMCPSALVLVESDALSVYYDWRGVELDAIRNI